MISRMQGVLDSHDVGMQLDHVQSSFKPLKKPPEEKRAPLPKLAAGCDPFQNSHARLFAFFFELAGLEVDNEASLTCRKLQAHIKKQKARAHPDRMCLQSNCSYQGWTAKCATVMGALDKAAEYLEHYIEGRTYYSDYWMHK